MTLLNILNKRISRNVIFWLSYVVLFGLLYGKYENNYSWYFLESACMLPFIMFATYMTIYVYLPFYFRKRLEILYENHYSLSVTENEESYKLGLEIRCK